MWTNKGVRLENASTCHFEGAHKQSVFSFKVETDNPNTVPLHFLVVLLLAPLSQRQLDHFCFPQSSNYQQHRRYVKLFTHLVSNRVMKADRNGARLPAWLHHQSVMIVQGDFIRVAEKIEESMCGLWGNSSKLWWCQINLKTWLF